jgi:putative oxidoreductase
MIKIYSYAARMFLGIVLVSAVLVRVFAPQLAASANFPPAAQAWLDVMKATGYLQTLLYLTEFIGGMALLMGIFVPFALILLAPIILNIALFHAFLDPRVVRIEIVLLMLGAHLLLVYAYRRSFMPLFQSVQPLWSGWKIGFLHGRLILQIFLGLAFAVPGATKLIMPEHLSIGNLLINGMKATGYLYPLLGVTELIAGMMLIADQFVPLVLVVLAPISLNIFLFHMFLDAKTLLIGCIILSIHIVLSTAFSHVYRSLLQPTNGVAE